MRTNKFYIIHTQTFDLLFSTCVYVIKNGIYEWTRHIQRHECLPIRTEVEMFDAARMLKFIFVFSCVDIPKMDFIELFLTCKDAPIRTENDTFNKFFVFLQKMKYLIGSCIVYPNPYRSGDSKPRAVWSGLFSFRLFVHFIRKVAIRRSLLQGKVLD